MESGKCCSRQLLILFLAVSLLQMASNDPDPLNPPGSPQPGDLIEIFRPAYQHWALYLGDGYIINLTPVGQYH